MISKYRIQTGNGNILNQALKFTGMIFLNIFIISIFTGCLNMKSPQRKIDYYSLEYDSIKPTGKLRLPIVLKVARFSSGPLFNTNKMIYKDKAYGHQAYTYHKWWAAPADLVSFFLARDLKESSLFGAVFGYDAAALCSHTLEGSLEEFYEQDIDERKWNAVVSVTVTLITENEPDVTKRVLFQKKHLSVQACEKRTPQGLAEAMSRAVSQISEKIMIDIYDVLGHTL